MQEQALNGLHEELGALADHLFLHNGNADELLRELMNHFTINTIFAHREHGLQSTFERDQRVHEICRTHNIHFQEFDHNGVQRGRKNRHHWDEDWRNYMQRPQSNVDLQTWPRLSPTHKANLAKVQKVSAYERQPSRFSAKGLNRNNSVKRLNQFLDSEASGYQQHIGEPLLSQEHCSRLSVALAWGTLSLREVYQQSLQKHLESRQKSNLRAFIARLHWHSHFIQKFEMEMRMEFENINRGFNDLRQRGNPEYLERWKNGLTGIPLVDACMRAVKSTGYLNFRMRAMVVSFWSHLLWQPWQMGVHHLAQCFSDYIPGIHYPQFQMQSSVTGINTIRVYNPLKQAMEKDSQGLFIQKWLPELAELPLAFQFEPWKLSRMEQSFYGFELGRDYPKPMVDVAQAAKFARDELWKMKQNPLVRVEAKRIVNMHTAPGRSIHLRTQKVLSQKANTK